MKWLFSSEISYDHFQVLGELAKSDSKHFLLLFRDQKCRYSGAYSWDQQSDIAHRIHGRGPNICHESMMSLMFKYALFFD